MPELFSARFVKEYEKFTIPSDIVVYLTVEL